MSKNYIIPLIILIFTLLVLTGCQPRVTDDVKMGIDKTYIAGTMIINDDIEVIKRKIEGLLQDIDNTVNKAEIKRLNRLIQNNKKLLRNIKEIRDWAFSEPLEIDGQ